jgi:uncharacterized protein (DUF2267 family)
VAIGDAVFRQLLQVGVRAERVPADTTIVGLLQEIQLYWYDKGQRKNTRQRDRALYRLLQEQEWHGDRTRAASRVVSVTKPTKHHDTVGPCREKYTTI